MLTYFYIGGERVVGNRMSFWFWMGIRMMFLLRGVKVLGTRGCFSSVEEEGQVQVKGLL